MTQPSLASQRHHCLESARRLAAARKVQAIAWATHQAALAVLEATGVKLEAKHGNGLTWNERQHAERNVSLVLPTQAPLTAAVYQAGTAWREFCEALEQCPAVQAELFELLGLR